MPEAMRKIKKFTAFFRFLRWGIAPHPEDLICYYNLDQITFV
jgi:hypothetical protein